MEFQELQQIVESNSRTIQAILEAQETERLRNEEYRREAAEERSELRQAIDAVLPTSSTPLTRIDLPF